ncbi:sensor histidine kinase [Streptomyces sp. NPDC059455]|uniref:sensor histidine kinase n=1 Tax=Streptomyces sp. NPDC059455 TaxID=3346837 RepID=UPI0036BBF175
MTHRLLLSYLSLTLLVLLCLEVPFGYVYASEQMSRFANTGQQGAVMLAEVLEENVEEDAASDVPQLAARFARGTDSHVIVVDRTGKVLTDSRGTRSTGTDLSADPDIAGALRNRSTTGTRQDPVMDGEAFSATMPGSSGTTVRCVVRVTYPLATVNQKIHDAWLVLAAVGVGVLAAVALIALALARWITRPVRALERATTQLANGTLTDPPATDLGPPELRQLASSFTHTASRLQHLLRAQEAFASEASHQLKTPLTSLRLRLENFEPYLDPRAQGSLDEAVGEVERLGRMVQGLLALARLESSATTPEPTDLDTVVADRAAMWTAFAAEHLVDIAVLGPSIGQVWAIPGALEQIIDNLLSNALRISPPGSVITLAKTPVGEDPRGPADVALHVMDQGPGMRESERRRAFDRFWRAADAYHDGTGLGLPIVQQLTRAGGGDITLDAAPGGGLDAIVRLKTADTRHSRTAARARHDATPPARMG